MWMWPMKFLLVVLAWHAFFLSIKIFISSMLAMEKKFVRGFILTVIGVVLLFTMIDPISKGATLVAMYLFRLSRWGVGNNLETNLIIVVLINFSIFAILHRYSKASKSRLLKVLYSLNSP